MFDSELWLRWLEARKPYQETCLFAVVPDVVGDAARTLARFAAFAPAVRALGYRLAFVAQDGLEALTPPWSAFDCLFIGASTTWKLGEHSHKLIAEAQGRGKWTHVGRVNSAARLRSFAAVGVDSVDGTYLAFGPDANAPMLMRWLADAERQRGLWGMP